MIGVLNFDDHKVCTNFSLEQLREEFKALDAMADAFEKDHEEQTVLALAVIYVGHKLRRSNN